MATILDMVNARQEEFKKDPTRATQSMGLAIAAVKEGIKSKAWEYYMAQFIDKSNTGLSVDQLARLKATDDTEGDPVMDRHRAYLVANSMCGPSTVDELAIGIESIDDGIATLQFEHVFPECDTTAFALAAKAPAKPSKKRPKYKKTAKG
jgi:hypothetical protein